MAYGLLRATNDNIIILWHLRRVFGLLPLKVRSVVMVWALCEQSMEMGLGMVNENLPWRGAERRLAMVFRRLFRAHGLSHGFL